MISDIAHLRMLGKDQEAQRLLDALNAWNRASRQPEIAMPAPANPMLYRDCLITADASQVSPSEFLDELFDDGPRECPQCGETLDENNLCDVGCLDLAPVTQLGDGRVAA